MVLATFLSFWGVVSGSRFIVFWHVISEIYGRLNFWYHCHLWDDIILQSVQMKVEWVRNLSHLEPKLIRIDPAEEPRPYEYHVNKKQQITHEKKTQAQFSKITGVASRAMVIRFVRSQSSFQDST